MLITEILARNARMYGDEIALVEPAMQPTTKKKAASLDGADNHSNRRSPSIWSSAVSIPNSQRHIVRFTDYLSRPIQAANRLSHPINPRKIIAPVRQSSA